MQKNERWIGVGAGSGNPSARLRAARSMPHWMETRGGLPAPPPPPPAPDLEPFPNDPDYEVIDVPGQAYSNTIPTTVEIRVKRCELCGASGPSVQCEQCPQQSFCPSCDEMYHRHPKRQAHVRRAIMDPTRPGEPPRPPLPPKGDSHMPAAPVPPPRRNKKNQLPIGSSSTLKRETGLVGSLRRMITGKTPQPPRPPPVVRDRSGSLINNSMDFHRNQMFGEMETNGWSRGIQGGGRAGSMTALNMSQGFGPMMHTQSVAHLGCPGCQGWGWGSQAALHQVGVHGAHGMHRPPHGGMHGSMHAGMHMPPPPQPYWYPSWDPRRHKRSHHSRHTVDSSSEEDEEPSPAMSRRSMRVVDSDSDDSFKKSRPHSRRESLADLRRRDDDTMSLRGGRYDDDTRSLRGHRKDSLRRREDTERIVRRVRRNDDTVSERGGLRHADETVSERGGVRRRPNDLLSDDRVFRRKDDDTFSERGGKRVFDRTEFKMKDDDSWDGNSKKSDRIEKKYQQDNSWDKPVDKRRDRYLADSDSDRRNKVIDDRKQNKITESSKVKSDSKNRSLGVESQSFAKSSETVSSIMSTTSGEDKARVPKKDKVFSDTGQRRRATLDSNELQGVVKNIPPENKGDDIFIEPEEEMKPLGPIPVTDWECQHCTYVNRPGCRVCEVCCKTRTLPLESSEQEDTATIETEMAELYVKEELKEDPKTEEQQKKKEPSPPSPRLHLVEASNGTQTTKNISLTSKGTSPPPQSISTQTYDVAGLNVKKTVSSEVGWSSPRRSFSRQSIISDTAQSGVSPPGSRSPGETDSQMTDVRQQKRSDLSSTLTRKPSRAGSLASEQVNNMVQKQVNQGLEMVKLLRDAEEVGFSGEEVSVAVEHCGDSNPLQWLLDNWTHMIDTVVTLATNYGHERKENTIGTVSEREARAALIMHQGSVWSAVTEVVQQRQNKYGELLSRGNFSREDIVTALTAHHGELEAAYTELTKGQLKPFLRRMWAPNNHIGEFEDQRADWDTTGRVETWLTQHVYQSLPKVKQEPTQQSRRHSDVHRFLKEVFAGQSIQSSFGDNNRYASLHSLAGKTGRGQFGGDFGAPPERYTSCLNLHEASTRSDLTATKLYPKQGPLYSSKPHQDNWMDRQVSLPERSPEFRGQFFLDRQESMPDNYMFEGLETPRNSQNVKWKNIELINDIPLNIRNDNQTDERSEYLENSKSEHEQIENEEEEEEEDEETQGLEDQVYNGRLQLLIQKNHKKKRRPKRTIKSYQSKFNIKSDIKHVKSNREDSLEKINRVLFVEKEETPQIGGPTHANQIKKAKKDSIEEYESIESSTDEEFQNNNGFNSRNSTLRKPQPKNERIIIIQRESPDKEEGAVDINHTEAPELKTNSLETLSDKESVSQSHSEGMGEQNLKELEASFSNSIPFIDEGEASPSGSSEEESDSGDKHPNQTDGRKSEDSSKHISPIEWSQSEKQPDVGVASTSGHLQIYNQSRTEENESPNNINPHTTTRNTHFDVKSNNESNDEEIDSENILEPEIHSNEENIFQNYDDKQEIEDEVDQSNESSKEEINGNQTNENEIKISFMSAEDEKDINIKTTENSSSEIVANQEILIMNQNKTADVKVILNSIQDSKGNNKVIKSAKHNNQVNDTQNTSQKKPRNSLDTVDTAVKTKSNDQLNKNKDIASGIAGTKESGRDRKNLSSTDNILVISKDEEASQSSRENKTNNVQIDNQTKKVQINNTKNKIQIDKTNKVQIDNQKNIIEPENQSNKVQSNTKNKDKIESLARHSDNQQQSKVQSVNEKNKDYNIKTNKVQNTTQDNKEQNANQINKTQSANHTNKIVNDSKTIKVQSTAQEIKMQNANQTNTIISENQTNKVQSTAQENKGQNAKQADKIGSDNQTNKVQSTTQENKVQYAKQANKILNDNKTNKVQSTAQEIKMQNANQTNKIISENQTNKVQSTAQENKAQNAKEANEIGSNNQTNKSQSSTQENKVQNADQTNKIPSDNQTNNKLQSSTKENKVITDNQTNKIQSNPLKTNVQTNNQTDKLINSNQIKADQNNTQINKVQTNGQTDKINQSNIVQNKTLKNEVQVERQPNKVLSDKTNIVLSNTQKTKLQTDKQKSKDPIDNQTKKVPTNNQINVQSDNQPNEVQYENQMDQIEYENKDDDELKTIDEVQYENHINEVQHENTNEVQNEVKNESTGKLQDEILTNRLQDENTGEHENQAIEVEYENRIHDTLNDNQTREGQSINMIIDSESEKENMINIEIIENIEKEHSDEASNEKVEVPSKDVSSKDEFRITTFDSGNKMTNIKMDENRSSPVVDMDENSDRDVSPIPTDSEREKSRSPIKGKIETAEDIKKNDKREEMVNLIRESLSKDVVLDRLVGTLLGVLQGGRGGGAAAEAFLKGQGLEALFQAEETVSVKEVTMEETGKGLVSALQIVKDINVNPKDALGEAIIKYDTISRSADIVRDEIQIKKDEFQREARKVLAEGLVTSYPQAELVVSLIELKFTPEEAVQAAAECTSIQSAISFLHQECPLCANKCTIKQIVGMLECDHRCCKECAYNYFNLQITEGSVWDCVCPFCRLPDLKASSPDQAQVYFSHLDILLKGILPEATHELFQRKLRDWTLAQDPNFKWCTKCSSGFITVPNQKILMCPDCRSITCAECRKPWEDSHEGKTCEEYGQLTGPENLLDKHLEEEGITCPACKARYSLARGGCMHMTCTSCKHEFCSGCSKPFLMGDRCQVSEYCGKLGLHAHHPRNCLFYLRDKEPQLLEQLLEENNISFDRDVSDQDQSGRCRVKLLKETDDGMIEGECSYPILAQALCRTHYVEHLVRLVRDRKLDPATVMDLTEAQQEMRRRGKRLPDRLPRQCDQSYLQSLIKIVQEEIPLE